MRQNPAFTDDLIADAYCVVAAGIMHGINEAAMILTPEMCMEAIEYTLHEGLLQPEDFDYATGEVEG